MTTDELNKLTPEQKRIRIAKLRGITVCPGCLNEIDSECCHCGDYLKSHTGYEGHAPVPVGCVCLYSDSLTRKQHAGKSPDYLNDLDAIHEVENVIPNERIRSDYRKSLLSVAGQPRGICHATAAQRADALLLTLA